MNPLTLPNHPRIVHPRTGVPVQAIGWHPRTGAPVWPIMGGDGSEDDKNDWSKVFEGKTPEQVKSELDAAVAAKSTGGDDSPWAKLFEGKTPEQVKTELDTFKSTSRTWEDKAKDKQGKAAVADTLLEILGLKDEPLKPEELKQQVTSAQTETKETKVENAVLRWASTKGGDGPALADSREFMTIVGKLDHTADDFKTKLTEAVETFVKDNPRYAASGTTTGRPAPVRQQGQQSEGKTGGVAAGATLFQETRTRKSAAPATT